MYDVIDETSKYHMALSIQTALISYRQTFVTPNALLKVRIKVRQRISPHHPHFSCHHHLFYFGSNITLL